MKPQIYADKPRFKQDGQDTQDNLKLKTLKLLFYPAYPIHPVKLYAFIRVHL
jgi:hypothetical protein